MKAVLGGTAAALSKGCLLVSKGCFLLTPGNKVFIADWVFSM